MPIYSRREKRLTSKDDEVQPVQPTGSLPVQNIPTFSSPKFSINPRLMMPTVAPTYPQVGQPAQQSTTVQPVTPQVPTVEEYDRRTKEGRNYKEIGYYKKKDLGEWLKQGWFASTDRNGKPNYKYLYNNFNSQKIKLLGQIGYMSGSASGERAVDRMLSKVIKPPKNAQAPLMSTTPVQYTVAPRQITEADIMHARREVYRRFGKQKK